MRNTIEKYIETYHMIKPGDKIIAAVSGGADSVCLLHLLAGLREKYRFDLRAVHVHHGLRGQEADRDSEFTKQLSSGLAVPCRVFYADVRGYAKEHSVSEEEAGRILRYQLLEQEAEAWEKGGTVKIAAAHHGDDNAETILYNLFRGSGLAGIGGILPVRDRIIRPLLCVSRKEILEYLKEYGLEHCEDSTNQTNDYTRNRMRRIILPAVTEEINPQASRHICQAGEKIRQAHEFIQDAADKWLSVHRDNKDPGLISDRLLSESEILQSYVLRRILAETAGTEKDLSSSHIDALLDLLSGQTGRRADLPVGIGAVREYAGLRIEKKNRIQEEKVSEGAAGSLPLEINVFPRGEVQENQEFPKNQYTKWFDYDKIENSLSVRTRRTGDYITIKGGGKKSVKAYMIDEKIPAADRNSIFLLADGSHILWIIGYRISEYYKISPQTTTILQAELNGGKHHGR